AAIHVSLVASNLVPQLDYTATRALNQYAVEQHVKAPAMNCILWPLVSGMQAARLGIDLMAIEPDKGRFPGWYADCVEHLGSDALVIQLSHRIGLDDEAHA